MTNRKYHSDKAKQHEAEEYTPGYDIQNRPTQKRRLITCPFCETETIAYLWSLSGGGKRCDGCGAMHTSLGKTWPTDKSLKMEADGIKRPTAPENQPGVNRKKCFKKKAR